MIKQVSLLYLWGSLVTLELISLIPLVGSLEENPLDNRLYIAYIRATVDISDFAWELHSRSSPILTFHSDQHEGQLTRHKP